MTLEHKILNCGFLLEDKVGKTTISLFYWNLYSIDLSLFEYIGNEKWQWSNLFSILSVIYENIAVSVYDEY